MANVFIGFHDQRNSSRVLKPPGGGTSNIFGGEIIPDVIPQHSRKEASHRGTSIQDVLKTETVTSTSTTRREESSSTTSGTIVVSEEHATNNDTNTNVVVETLPDVAAEVICKVEQMKIEERSSKAEITETDSDGNAKVILSESNSEGSVEQNSSVKKGSTIADILSQDEILEKKKIKGSPTQRVPPGGYSSGLW